MDEEVEGRTEVGTETETETFGLEVAPEVRAARIRRYLDPDAVPIHLIPRVQGAQPPNE